MSDIAPIPQHNAGFAPVERLGLSPASTNGSQASSPSQTPTGALRGRDEVDISEQALFLSRIRQAPAIRQALVDRVRSEIQAGTYESEAKVDQAAKRLAEELDLLG